MILQMRRNRHEVLTLMSTGFVLPPEHCEFVEAATIMEKMKVILMEHVGTMPSGYWFELVTKDVYMDTMGKPFSSPPKTTEIPADIDTADGLYEWYMMEVQ